MLNECASLKGGILDILDHYRMDFKKCLLLMCGESC